MRAAVALSGALVALLTGCDAGSPGSTAVPSATRSTPVPTSSTVAPTAAVTTSGPVDPLSPQPPRETAARAGQPVCVGSALTVTDADTLVTPQYKHEVFVVRTSGPPCALTGYPAVQLLGADGAPLPVRVQHGGFGLPPERPATVTLSRETSLSFALATSRDGSCTDVATVLARLPGTSTTHRVPTELRVCGATVGVSPVHRTTDQD